ncbi:putative DNA-directed DNA polymerase [Helianthus annuus]|uniref:DNA-directed DNA polymerase n=1 Tax=Helianthus annuus TaxID=4232 RepID=A0A251SF67_HELAN|nr:helicase and polymerase-containing protein TEBICHI [Helianthus annuus]KAF5797771.1 putative DNA-directed DNA polymerase [Helianthus annuus]KAJ0549456.1 putative DNA-directed DNA polymerase [Helianthus annuus]KAJ0562412.1 putative DNA-directed DNA polymerase [Helianthus annuus]KAJ0727786.1 putative DNA-directed DNA polymerase [Helianthus annuus]KAJ0730581.1 putative DNA-directed DNA polymerase [Helianthus annuus]
MASDGSSRSRVDQFFSSKKKKKFVSPLSKSGKVEPDAKLSVDGSPSAKGSLSNYLVSSQNEARNLSTVPTARGPSDNQDQVRRNLTSAIESSNSVHGVENPELQQFATNFLSYYCSDLPTTQVNAHKRPGSPSVRDLEDKLINKRHISSVGNPSHDEEHQTSLRKCNRTSTEVADMALCNTPSLTTVKVGGEETPQSMRGSSMFSPGDTFWKEAIQVADGMSKANADLASSGQNGNSIDKEVSPLPVKHFDFSCEDKRMVVDAPIMSTPCNQVQSLCKLQDTNSSCVITKRRSDDISPPNDNRMSISPNTDIKSYNVNGLNSVDNTPSSSLPPNDRLDISNWLPSEICKIYKRRGISKLYPWQVDCLQVDGVLQKRNLVYCASTSAGKSFVAEILMLRRVLSTRKVALLVLPYVSICAEKAEHLEALLEPLDKHVRSYYGSQGGGALPKDTSVAVCTIEKANSLLNRLLEEGRLSEVGIIVIDELHMVGDQHRGYLLELMLTKLRYGAGEGRVEFSSGESSGTSSGKMDPTHGLQIVGMSATLPNVGAVADWLQAALYQTDFRPVPLEEYIKVGNSIYNKKMELVRMIPKRADLGGKDPDNIIELCNEVVQEGHSVLIFCSSRKGCESTAKHVAKYLKSFSMNVNGENEYPDVASAIDALKKSPAGLDPVLSETLPAGVAYHHAGLTVEEREVVENCYRKGLVRVLTATSTLAAGVNLPARRVIFRQPRIGRDFIDGTRYRQMSGRAGRTGIDTKGESVLICKPEEVKRIVALIGDSCPPLHSCLSEDKNGMTHAILEVVAGGIVQTANDIHRYVRCTLLNSTQPFEDVVKSAKDSLKWLCHRKFLEWSEETKLYSTTPLGRASFGSSLCPEESLIVLDDLTRAREGFVLASDLHLVYLVTPINVDVEPDWELYYERFMQMSALDQSVGNRVGVQEPFLMRMAHGAPIRSSERSRHDLKGLGVSTNGMLTNDQMLRVCKRFYVALILSKLVQEVPVAEVCEAFKVARGMVQSLQENAGRFASMVAVFCERLGWHDLESLFAKFQNRVSFGVRAEIAELTTIPYVKGARARALYKAGLRTPQAIAEASVLEIAKAIFESSSWDAQENTAQKRIQLGVAKKIMNGARKIVLDKAEEARAAAFSAFKALGVDVPQFSLPKLPSASVNFTKNEPVTSSREDTTSSDCVNQKDIKSNTTGLTEAKPSNAGLMTSAEENSDDTTLSKSGADITVIKVEKPCDVGLATSAEENSDDTTLSNSGADITVMKHNGVDENQNLPEKEHIRVGNKERTSEKGPTSAVSMPGGFDSFLDMWDATQEFFFDIHFNKRSEFNTIAPFELHGIAICWEDSPVYYISIPKDLFSSDNKIIKNPIGNINLEVAIQRWARIGMIMGKSRVRKFGWNLKIQNQVLKHPAVSIQRFGSLTHTVKTIGVELVDNSYYMFSPVHLKEAVDLSVVVWILWPDDERSSNPNLEKEIKKRLPGEMAAAANQKGRWKNQMRRAAHNGCCRRVAQTRALSSVLWKLLTSENLLEPLVTTEMPLVNVLADMELSGIGVDMDGCIQSRHVVAKKLRYLENEAYRLAGTRFSLYTSADIADVLYTRLKLPVPEGYEGKNHPSTDKHCLEMLRLEHPIIPIIKEHRTLAKLLNCTLGSMCSLAKLSMKTQRYTLHGHWLQTSTATGRLSMEDPNLQCVEHMVEFKIDRDENETDGSNTDHYKVNPRDFFIPTQENWLLVTADYSQIELRLMAHFSKDTSLIELLTKPSGDVFNMITAKWTGKAESSVDPTERDQTKRLVYGILYGMGANSLAEQLECSPDDANEKIQSFKRSFPGVSSWLKEAVAECRKKGYVETLMGRKRFLAKIKFGNTEEKSKAQRQAVNSICQGSAADIIKVAMITIHSVVGDGVEKSKSSVEFAERFHMLKGRCRILLQVHDELILEADPSVMNEAGMLLKLSMESAASLLVPLIVKLKRGRTWGSLEPVLPS